MTFLLHRTAPHRNNCYEGSLPERAVEKYLCLFRCAPIVVTVAPLPYRHHPPTALRLGSGTKSMSQCAASLAQSPTNIPRSTGQAQAGQVSGFQPDKSQLRIVA